MKKVLVLGAGMVAGPLVRYLLDQGYQLTVTSLVLAEAEALVGGHPQGRALTFTLDDEAGLDAMVAAHDLVISLVPFNLHPLVAGHCLAHGKNLVTASYVAPAMAALDQKARERDLIFLNEIGLDPGIDHMSAMRIIDAVHGRGGYIKHFRSYCGGLPAPEANDNPLGYKFSWAPRGVLLAGCNGASYREDGHVVETPSARLFRDMHLVSVPGAGDFEAYPNRDSLMYLDIYGLGEKTETILRGTLRNHGWCDSLFNFARVGLLDQEERDSRGQTCGGYFRQLLGCGADQDLRQAAATKMGVSATCLPPANLEWLGLFSDQPIGRDAISPLDLLGKLMLARLQYGDGDRDLVVLFHEFKAVFPDSGRYERLTSTMVGYGVPGGDSAMARTVSLPAAIAARLVLEGKISQRGVLRPVSAEIYEPVLTELARLDIDCQEEMTTY